MCTAERGSDRPPQWDSSFQGEVAPQATEPPLWSGPEASPHWPLPSPPDQQERWGGHPRSPGGWSPRPCGWRSGPCPSLRLSMGSGLPLHPLLSVLPPWGTPQRPALTSTPSIFSLSRASSAQLTSCLPFPWPVREPTQTCLTHCEDHDGVHSTASAQAPGLESLPKGTSCPWTAVPSYRGRHTSPGCAHQGDRCGPAPPGVALGPR